MEKSELNNTYFSYIFREEAKLSIRFKLPADNGGNFSEP